MPGEVLPLRPEAPEPPRPDAMTEAPAPPGSQGEPVLILQDVVDFVQECRKAAEDAWRDRRKVWDELWEQYALSEDLSHKKPWESKVQIPKSHAAVKKAVSLIRHILMREDTYFDVRPVMPEDQPAAVAMKKAIGLAQMNMAKKKTFIGLALEAIEWGFTLGEGIIKLYGEEEPENRVRFVDTPQGPATYQDTFYRWRLAGRVVDPRTMWSDPDGRFDIEETYNLLSDIKRLTEGPTPVYDPGQVAQLEKDDYGTDTEEAQRLEDLGIKDSKNSFLRKVFLQEYWGDLFDKEGRLIRPNVRIVVANKKYVLNPPTQANPNAMDNPFWHGKRPYLKVTPLRFLGREGGQGLYESVRSIQKAINNLARMSMDGMLWRLMKIIQVIRDRLVDETDLNDLKPGKTVEIRGDGPAIFEAEFSDLPGSALSEGEVLHREFQAGSGVTEFITGLPRTKGDTTATEMSLKTQEANSYFESIAREIEDQLMEAGVEITRQLLLQYWDALEPRMADVFGGYALPIDQMTREQRVYFLQTDVDVQCRGISSYFERSDALKNIINLLEIAAKIPAMYARLNIRAVLGRILSSVQLADVDQLLISDQEEARLQAMEQAQRMSAGQGGGQVTPEVMQQAMQRMQAAGLSPEQMQQAMAQAFQSAGGGNGRPQTVQ